MIDVNLTFATGGGLALRGRAPGLCSSARADIGKAGLTSGTELSDGSGADGRDAETEAVALSGIVIVAGAGEADDCRRPDREPTAIPAPNTQTRRSTPATRGEPRARRTAGGCAAATGRTGARKGSSHGPASSSSGELALGSRRSTSSAGKPSSASPVSSIDTILLAMSVMVTPGRSGVLQTKP